MIDQLVVSLALVCGLHNPKVSEQEKIACIDWHVNCVIGLNNSWTQKEVEACTERWKNGERYSDK